MLYRIVQEALTNVVRHSAATCVDISLHTKAGCLTLEIRDNGKGIGSDAMANPKAIGLLGMKERAMAVGALFEIEGFPGTGTLVTVQFPLAALRK